ncbi:MAG: DUF2723 domain-containing protein [Ignavibacteria bacterium]
MRITERLSKLFFKHYALFTSIVVLIFYLRTLAPGVIESDSGELAAVQYTLGIAHPTGYPLFTILGFIFSHLPIPLRPITKLNLLTALWSSGAIYVLTITIKFLLDTLPQWISSNISYAENIYERFNVGERIKIISAVFGGLVFGFSKTLWFQSLSVEVYTLHTFLFSLIFYFMVKAFLANRSEIETSFFRDKWFIAFIFLSLGFTNHLSTIFIIPSFLFLYFYKWNFSKLKIQKFVVYALIGISITTLIYLYIPIRAKMQPFLNWGNPVTFESFINHITGRLYHQFLFPSFGDYISNIGKFLNSFTINLNHSEFSGSDFSIVILIAFLGLLVSFFYFKKLFQLLLLIFLTTMVISALYNIPDIDAYYLPAFMMVSIFSGLGIFYLTTIKMSKKTKQITIAIVFLISISMEIYQNYSRVDLSDHKLMDDYTLTLLNSVDENSIVLSARSSFYFPSLYYQLVERVRPDIVIAEHYLLQQKWYYTQLNKIHPGVIQLRDTVVSLNYSNRSVYFSPEMLKLKLQGEVKIPHNYELVPYHFLFKLVPRGNYVEEKQIDYNFDFSKSHLFETREIKNTIINMLLNRAVYELIYGNIEKSKQCLKKLKKDFPEYELPTDLMKILNE